MATASSPATPLNPATPPESAGRAELSEIDASARLPVLFFLGAALLWLMVGTAFALISSFKLHTPGFLGDIEWLTYGRVRTAYLDTVIYGWGVNAAFAVAFWLMARLSRGLLRHPGLLAVAGVFWNIGVVVGVGGILTGDSTSVEWLEFPAYATPLLFVAYALVAAWAVSTLRYGRSGQTYVSQWYILAALFWFPWFYSVAQIMLVLEPARGTVQSIVNAWYAHNLLGLWFAPIALGAIYYFLPKVLGKPIHGYYLAGLGFWSFALFQGWAGTAHLVGGPVPAWTVTVGVAASFMLTIPVVVIAINHHLTLFGNFGAVKSSPTLRFIAFGAVSFTLASLIGVIAASRQISEVVQFTQFSNANADHMLYAFFTMVMFGAIYYILPRLLLKEWPSALLINLHFWAAATGITLLLVVLYVLGVKQGLQMNNADIPFIKIVRMTVENPVFNLVTASVAGLLIAIGHLAFAVNVVWMLVKPRTSEATGPALFRNPPELEVAAQ